MWWASRLHDLPFNIAQAHDDIEGLKKQMEDAVATLTALTYQFASEANPSPSAEALNRSLRTNGSRADGVQR